MVRRTHNILQWLFAIFVLYLLITRLFISWIQFFPEQLVKTVDVIAEVKLDFTEIELSQNWSGFSVNLDNVSVKATDFVFQAEKFKFDFNLFFFALPSIDYGDSLFIKNGAYQISRASKLEQPAQSTQGLYKPEEVIDRLSDIDLNIERLWKKVRFENLIVSEISPGLSIQFNELHSLKKSYLSVVSEFSLSYGDVLNYEPFNLRATVNPNIWGSIESGDISLSSFKPLKVQSIARLLPQRWQTVLPNGEVILDSQLSFVNSKLSRSVINLHTQSLSWKQDSSDLPESLGLQFEWKRSQQNMAKAMIDWEFDLSQIQINNQYVDSIAPVKLKFDGGDFIKFSSEKFDLEPFEVIIKALMKNELAGDVLERAVTLNINDLTGRFNWKTLNLTDLSLFFERLDLPVTDFPGMSLRDLRLIKVKQKITIESSKPVWVLEPKINPKPMKVELPAMLALGYDEVNHAWNLPKLKLKVNQIPISMSVSQINNDYIDAELLTEFQSMAQLKRYLPYGLMSEQLQDWLKNSLTGGKNIVLDGQIRGLYKNFPFTDNNGLFEFKAKVQDAKLKFNSQWPELTQFDAELFFKPYQLDIKTPKVNLGASNVGRNISVSIPNLHKKDISVQIKGDAESELVNAIEYLQSSPIAEKTGLKTLFDSGAQFSGKVKVKLDEISVPISGFKDKEESVQGRFWLSGAKLKLNEQANFTGIDGQFYFDTRQLSAKNVSFKSFQGDGKLDIKTNLAKEIIELKAKGQALKVPNVWFREALNWNASLKIPFKTNATKGSVLDVNVDIDKAQSKMPYPLDVNSLKEKSLTVNALLEDKKGRFNYQLANVFQGRGTYQKPNRQFKLDNMQIVIGSQSFKGLPHKGSYIIGNLNQLNLEQWLSFYQSMPASQKIENSQEGLLSSLDWETSKVTIDDFRYLSNRFNNLQVSWLLNQEPLKISFSSKDATGSVELKDHENVIVDIKKLYLSFLSSNKQNITSEQTNPKALACKQMRSQSLAPKITFTGKNIFIDDREIEKLSFTIVDQQNQKRFDALKGSFGRGAGQMSGRYVFDKNINQSRLETGFVSSKVAEVMTFLKIDKGFTGKKAQVSLDLNWEGNIDCFKLQEANGNIKFALEEGSIEDVEPGLARLIGLLSVESLVRRLKLDLKDVTNKGLVYDTIKGNGSISKGKLNLQKFEMKAPSANAQLDGTLDLITENFDLVATVTPKVGAAIPTIAALAGSTNPLAALAVYTIMKILPKVNENLITYEYTVKGPWENPSIKAKNEKQQKEEPSIDPLLE